MTKYKVLPLLLLALFACMREEDIVIEQPQETLSTSDEELIQAFYEPGVANVLFDDETASEIEGLLVDGDMPVATKSTRMRDIIEELDIVSMHRVFPDAGPFEERTRREGLHRWYEVRFNVNNLVTKAAVELSDIPGIIYAEPLRKVAFCSFNDPQLKNQWHYINTQNPDYDVNIKPVWDEFTTGNPAVIVAVVDQGVDLEHEDLAANCIPGGPDGSFNFANGDYNVDPMSHGTHVAGTIAAVNNNSKGVAGIAGGDAANGKGGVRILSCQFFGNNGNGSSAAAIKWGADHGAVISSNSWGYVVDINEDGYISDSEMTRARGLKIGGAEKAAVDYFIKYAGCDNAGKQLPDSPMKGGIVIFSAGNDNIPYGAPANYDKILSVGSIDRYGNRSSFSNYGDWVDICAPGSNILSTLPDNKYGTMSGTSMACPHVSGVAAIVVSQCGGQGFTADMLWTKLVNGGRKGIINENNGPIGPLVDAYGAILYGDSGDPGDVSEYTVTSQSNNIILHWNVPASSDGNPTYAAMLYASKEKSALENLDPAHPGKNVFTGSALTSTIEVGKEAEGVIRELEFESTYYVTMVPYSYNRVFAKVSPIKQVTTGPNHAPVVKSLLEGKAEWKNWQTATIPLLIEDPDDHTISVSYIPGSAADQLGVDAVNGGYAIFINGPKVAHGTYTAKIKVTDQYGLQSTTDISYTLLENHSPEVLTPIENQTVKTLGEGGTLKFSMNKLFTDPDGEPLSIDIQVSDKTVLHAVRSGDELIITPLKYGVSKVILTAVDARKATSQIVFSVLANDGEVEVKTYPNPVIDIVYVMTGVTEEETEFSVYSASGALVYKGKQTASAFSPASIDMSECAPGRYAIVFTYEGKLQKQTIVKK